MTTRVHPSAAERRRRVAALRAIIQARFGAVLVPADTAEPVDPLMVERLQRAIDAPRCRRSKIGRNQKPGIS